MSVADRLLLWIMRRRGFEWPAVVPPEAQTEWARVRQMTDDAAAAMALLDDTIRNAMRRKDGGDAGHD